jgi:hypothetical protein
MKDKNILLQYQLIAIPDVTSEKWSVYPTNIISIDSHGNISEGIFIDDDWPVYVTTGSDNSIELAAEIRSLDHKMESRFNEMESRFSKVDAQFNEMDSRFEKIFVAVHRTQTARRENASRKRRRHPLEIAQAFARRRISS